MVLTVLRKHIAVPIYWLCQHSWWGLYWPKHVLCSRWFYLPSRTIWEMWYVDCSWGLWGLLLPLGLLITAELLVHYVGWSGPLNVSPGSLCIASFWFKLVAENLPYTEATEKPLNFTCLSYRELITYNALKKLSLQQKCYIVLINPAQRNWLSVTLLIL